jgi:hypothetical protein
MSFAFGSTEAPTRLRSKQKESLMKSMMGVAKTERLLTEERHTSIGGFSYLY